MTDAGPIAARLQLSARTLRRHLAAEARRYATSWTKPGASKAIELMTLHHLNVEQVALRLGHTPSLILTGSGTSCRRPVW